MERSRMKNRIILPALCLLAAALVACPRPEPDHPTSAYQAFYRAAAAGEWPAVYAMLDGRSRRCLEWAADLLALQTGVPEAAAFYLRQLQGQFQAPLREIRLIREEGEQAELEVAAGSCESQENCVRRRVRLLREDGRWRVSPEIKKPLVSSWGKEEC